MKKRSPFILILLSLIFLLLISCTGDRSVKEIIINEGLKSEYEIGEAPDFSGVRATVVYNDDTTVSVEYKDLVFGEIDTSTPGTKALTIKYEDFILYKTINVIDIAFDPSKLSIIKVSLPDAFDKFEASREGFINTANPYVVGDDNSFYFKLKLFTISQDKIPTVVNNYTSSSLVYLENSDTPLSGEELLKYVAIDEEKNAFDFTEEAIGRTFTISTRPLHIQDEKIEAFTKSFTVTVVDGYNIYKAYELNYISNTDSGFSFTENLTSETRGRLQILDDFLKSEKNSVRPENISAIVIHNHLTVKPTDIPKEYFHEKNRANGLHNAFAVYNHEATEATPSFSVHGNYFSVFTYDLPNVDKNSSNALSGISYSHLFDISSNMDNDKNYDHTAYSFTLNNLHLADDNSTSTDEDKTADSLLGLGAFLTFSQVINFNNVKIEAFLSTVNAEGDYQTVNITESKFSNSWHNHIAVISENKIQDETDEPIDKSIYPRLTLNINKSIITQSGGPAIISQTRNPSYNCNKNSGAVVNISEDTKIESWVTGTEAWFTAVDIGISMDFVLQNLFIPLESSLNDLDSSFMTEKSFEGDVGAKRYFNLVMLNLIVPDFSNGLGDLFQQLQGKIDIDGMFTIGNKEIINMDDHTYGGKTYNFKNQTLSDVKETSKATNLVLYTPSGGVAHTSASDSLKVDAGSIAADETNNYLTVLYLSVGIVLGNYHPIK